MKKKFDYPLRHQNQHTGRHYHYDHDYKYDTGRHCHHDHDYDHEYDRHCLLMMMTSILVRLHNEGAGGAWCPREPVSREKDQQWIQVGPHHFDHSGDYYKPGNYVDDYGDYKAGLDDQLI